MYLYMGEYICVYVYVLRMQMCVCVHVCVSVGACIHVYVCVYVCVFAILRYLTKYLYFDFVILSVDPRLEGFLFIFSADSSFFLCCINKIKCEVQKQKALRTCPPLNSHH